MSSDSMRVSAKHVIVELLSAGPITGDHMPVRELVRAAQAFGIAENSVRVAIVRLRADGIDGDVGYPTSVQLPDGPIFTAWYMTEPFVRSQVEPLCDI